MTNESLQASPEAIKARAGFKIPFSPPYIDQFVIDEVVATLQSGWITSGPKVKALEEECRIMSGCDGCVCVNSWTSGAALVLKWLGVGAGDEVIIPAYTYAATAITVMHTGARPVMVDVLDDLTIDPAKIREAINSKTKAIIPVDISGWPCDYPSINTLLELDEVKAIFSPSSEIQEKLGRILIISDAAHSMGASYHHMPAAIQSDITIYSLHAVKNITTAEGGVVCLNLPEAFDNKSVYQWMKLNSLNGQTKDAFSKNLAGEWRYDIVTDGLKINMPDVCAAIGLAQIRQYRSFLLPERRRVFERYHSALKVYDWAERPVFDDGSRISSFHVYALRIRNISEMERDKMIRCIAARGISVNVHFLPLPMLTLFKNSGYDIADYPNSFDQYSREISLPVYPQLSNEEIDFIIETLVDAYREMVS